MVACQRKPRTLRCASVLGMRPEFENTKPEWWVRSAELNDLSDRVPRQSPVLPPRCAKMRILHRLWVHKGDSAVPSPEEDSTVVCSLQSP